MQLSTSDNIPIKRNELSKQIFDYLSSFYEPLLSQINPYKLGEKKRMLDIGEMYARRILLQYHQELKVEDYYILVDYLVNGCPDHGHIIDFDIISRYLPYVKKSSTFGEDYSQKLAQLSGEFIRNPGNNIYVGFVYEPVLEDKDESSETPDTKEKQPREEIDKEETFPEANHNQTNETEITPKELKTDETIEENQTQFPESNIKPSEN